MKERNYKFDNLKFLLIVFVVLCHMFELFGGDIRYRIYMFIYMFHMPLFVFVSGYFGKFNIKNILFKQIYPYIIFQSLFCYFFEYSIRFEVPYWLLWYIVALAVWNFSLIIAEKNIYITLVISIILSVAVQYIDFGDQPVLYRTIGFYPYFILGKLCSKHRLFLKSNYKINTLGCLVIILMSFISYKILPLISTNWLFYSKPFADTGCNTYFRCLLMLLSCGWGAGFLLLIPDKKIPIISKSGSYSICAFLIHGFVQRIFLYYNNPFIYSENINLILSFLVSTGIVVLTCNKYAYFVLRYIIDLNYPFNAIKSLYKITKERLNI